MDESFEIGTCATRLSLVCYIQADERPIGLSSMDLYWTLHLQEFFAEKW
jgi:hypothetical protein